MKFSRRSESKRKLEPKRPNAIDWQLEKKFTDLVFWLTFIVVLATIFTKSILLIFALIPLLAFLSIGFMLYNVLRR